MEKQYVSGFLRGIGIGGNRNRRNIAFIALIIYVKSDSIITIDPNVNINKIILIFCYYCDTNLKKNKNISR